MVGREKKSKEYFMAHKNRMKFKFRSISEVRWKTAEPFGRQGPRAALWLFTGKGCHVPLLIIGGVGA